MQNSIKLSGTKCVSSDLEEVSDLLFDAYSIWAEKGYVFPRQTVEQLSKYFLRDGWVFRDDGTNEISGGVCVMEAKQRVFQQEDKFVAEVARPHRIDRSILNGVVDSSEFAALRLLYSYSLATVPRAGRSGLGAMIGQWIFEKATAEGYQGVLFETGKDTEWLLKWYQSGGYQIIGESDPNDRSAPTRVFMMKQFNSSRTY
jgi:hypothetical protein